MTAIIVKRPLPPLSFLSPHDPKPYISLIPADDIAEWVNEQIIRENGNLHNPEHLHLMDADLCFLWASSAVNKRGRIILGQAEEVMMRVGGWQKSRMEQQMYEWFGHVPDFIITLAADYCSQCGDIEFCALVEHELYHITQQVDEFGNPKFTREGTPKLTLRGHDIEEFVGVVRRYGASKDVQELVDAANSPAEVGHIDIARACGNCLMKLA